MIDHVGAPPPGRAQLERIGADIDPTAPPEPRVEPKFVARRLEVRRAARRHRRRLMMMIGAMLTLMALAAGLLFSPLFDVDRLAISGTYRLTDAEVADSLKVNAGTLMLDVDPDALAARVKRMPWVRSVTVERQWPDTVRVELIERTPVAVIAGRSDTRLVVAADGRVVASAGSWSAGLPAVTVEGSDRWGVGSQLPAAVARSVALVRVLPVAVRVRMKSASVSAAGELTVALSPSGDVFFGNAEDAARKFEVVATLLSGSVALQCLSRVDVRVPGAPALTRRPGC